MDFISVGFDNTDGIDGFLDIINFLIDQPTVPTVLTTSYGFDEDEVTQSLATCVFHCLLMQRTQLTLGNI